MNWYILALIVLTTVHSYTAVVPPKSAITYTLNGGRLGNNFLTYMHAKWVSYHFDIPLLYVPFPYSDQLVLHDIEQPYSQAEASKKFSHVVTFKRGDPLCIDRNAPTLYVLLYFPECLFEIEYNSAAFYFAVPWDNEGFKAELKKCIQPKKALSLMQKPDNVITVAVHVRKSSNGVDGFLSHDFPEGLHTPNMQFMDLSFPYCMPPDTYYIEQIKNLANLFSGQSLSIYILSDDKNVDKITEKYRQAINIPNIEFVCRTIANNHEANILEDFFFMAQCDCLIRSESSYAVAASKLANYLVQISPTHHTWHEGRHLVMDEAKIVMRKNPVTTNYTWIWPHFAPWCKCKV